MAGHVDDFPALSGANATGTERWLLTQDVTGGTKATVHFSLADFKAWLTSQNGTSQSALLDQLAAFNALVAPTNDQVIANAKVANRVLLALCGRASS